MSLGKSKEDLENTIKELEQTVKELQDKLNKCESQGFMDIAEKKINRFKDLLKNLVAIKEDLSKVATRGGGGNKASATRGLDNLIEQFKEAIDSAQETAEEQVEKAENCGHKNLLIVLALVIVGLLVYIFYNRSSESGSASGSKSASPAPATSAPASGSAPSASS